MISRSAHPPDFLDLADMVPERLEFNDLDLDLLLTLPLTDFNSYFLFAFGDLVVLGKELFRMPCVGVIDFLPSDNFSLTLISLL